MTEAEWLACEDPERLLEVVDGKPSGRKRRLVAAGCCRLVAPLLPEGLGRAAPDLAEALADGLGDEAEAHSLGRQLRELFWALEDRLTPDGVWGPALGEFDRWYEGYARRASSADPLAEAAYESAPDRGRFWEAGDTRPGLAAGEAAQWATLKALDVAYCATQPHRLFDEREAVQNTMDALAWAAVDAAAIPYRPELDDAAATLRAVEGIWEQGRVEAARRCCSLLRDLFPFGPVAVEPGWRTPAVLAPARAAYDERRFERLPLLASALEEAGCTSGALLAHLRSGRDHVKGCWAVDLVLGLA
jgi:hypothetical protein